jgi:ribose 5-phosphate isomerase B
VKKLIKEDDVKKAAKEGRKIVIDKNIVLTPGARDLGKTLDIFTDPKENAAYISPQLSQKVKRWPLTKIAMGADHGGFHMKEELKSFLRDRDFIVTDLGATNSNASDYPDFAFKVAQTVAEGKADCGIIIDSVGIGSAIAANKVPGILAAKCNNSAEAKSAREHNYANILTLGSKIIGIINAQDIVLSFLQTKGGEERHQKRIAKIINYENKRK